jgi:hypothetical protein
VNRLGFMSIPSEVMDSTHSRRRSGGSGQEAEARLVEDILPSSTAPFIPFSPSSQFVSKETGLKGNEAPREEQPVKVVR